MTDVVIRQNLPLQNMSEITKTLSEIRQLPKYYKNKIINISDTSYCSVCQHESSSGITQLV